MTNDTLSLSDSTPVLTLCAASAGAPTGPRADITAAVPGLYTVYTLEELASGRHYVGLTRRSLDARIASHLSQSRRCGRVRPDGLMAALRLMDALGQDFGACFCARVLGQAETPEAARELERYWVTMLDCRVPRGFNGMPGGSSVGGVDNARPLCVKWPDGSTRSFISIQAALTVVNRDRLAAGKSKLEASTVYARLAGDWPVEEALGLTLRQDPRAVRSTFAIEQEVYTTLAAASRATDLGVATLRSRLHRARASSAEVLLQVGRDRRGRGPGRLTRLDLPWPGTGEKLTAAAYASRAGVPKATVMHRWHRAQTACGRAALPSADALHGFLTAAAAGKCAAAAALARLLAASPAGPAPQRNEEAAAVAP